MGVTGKEDGLIFIGQIKEEVEEDFYPTFYFRKFIFKIEVHGHQYLIVPGTCSMDLLASIAQFFGEYIFYFRMHILKIVLNGKLAAVNSFGYIVQFPYQIFGFLGSQETDFPQHFGMCLGGDHIVFGQVQVQFPIVPYRKMVYFFVGAKSFVPKFHFLLFIFPFCGFMRYALGCMPSIFYCLAPTAKRLTLFRLYALCCKLCYKQTSNFELSTLSLSTAHCNFCCAKSPDFERVLALNKTLPT